MNKSDVKRAKQIEEALVKLSMQLPDGRRLLDEDVVRFFTVLNQQFARAKHQRGVLRAEVKDLTERLADCMQALDKQLERTGGCLDVLRSTDRAHTHNRTDPDPG